MVTRRQAEVKDNNRKKTQRIREKLTELRKKEQDLTRKRRQNCIDTHTKVKLRRLEEKNKELKEALESSANELASTQCEPSPNFFKHYQSLLNIHKHQNLLQPHSAPPTTRLMAEASTRLKNTVGLSQRNYEKLRNELAMEGIGMPSPSTIKRKSNQISDGHCRISDRPDFYGLIEKAVMKHDFSSVPNVRITICGDGGGDGDKFSVKICCFFNDIALPLSIKNLMIIWSYVGKETREKLKDILKYIDPDILNLIENGIFTKSGLKQVIITYIGDCKFLCISFGLQGGSAVCGCSHCVTKRSNWATAKSEDIVPRTISSIVANAEEVVNNNGKPALHESVDNFPLLFNIPVTHIAPPPLHILICLVNSIVDYIRKYAPDNVELEEFLSEAGVRLHYPAKAFEGNACRKNLKQFREETSNKIIYGGFGSNLFEAAANIEKHAVARTLLEEEIDDLDDRIRLFFNLLKEYGQVAVKFFLNKNKIHMLQHHVVPFVRRFKSWGLFSEQSGESIHHVRNDLDDRIPGTGPKADEKRNTFFQKNQAVSFHFS
uniref:Uncharacterized protein n=1 Tax=Panagrolaimus superbus TaxID=310955 RepID=A0A914Z0U6_9BILA